MAREVNAHETRTSMVEVASAEVDGGSDIALRVRVLCPAGCDLRGGKMRIADDEGAVMKETELTEFDGTASGTGEFKVKAPVEPGGYTWSALFALQQKEGVLHEESSAPFSFIVKPHLISMAVWDVPSPIALNDRFTVKVGVKCSAECNLVDKKIAVYGQKGKKVATGALGGVAWPGTSALYWAEVELEAPGVERSYSWRVRFLKPDLDLPHEEASYTFAFGTAAPPEHVVTVKVIDKAKKTPIKSARVTLRSRGAPYRNRTDDGGVARLSVPKGQYKLYVSADSKQTFQTTVDVASDTAVEAELLVGLGIDDK